MATTFKTLYQYAQRQLGGYSDSNALAVAKEVTNEAVRYLAERNMSYYRERRLINVIAPFSSGTVTVTPGATYCSLSSGGSWSSDYDGGMIRIGTEKVAYAGAISSNPARFTFDDSATWGYDTNADQTYTLYRYKYALPTNFKQIDMVLDEVMLSDVRWLDDLSEFEKYRLQNYPNQGPFEVACIAEGFLWLWPPTDRKQVIPMPYYRWPTDMSADTDNVDYPDTGGQLILVKRSIDYQAALQKNNDGDIARTRELLKEQEKRTRGYAHRYRGGTFELGRAASGPYRVTKVVGEDD